MNQEVLSCTFEEKFNKSYDYCYFSPGRVNLIGEHIDYNGGMVFPCSITLGTYALVKRRDDTLFKMYSVNFDQLGVITFSLDNLAYDKSHQWVNYVKGVVSVLLKKGHTILSGMDMLVYGNIPNGAGLSSSASLELLVAKVVEHLFDLELTPVEMALIGKEVENTYIGVNSGIMDQFAIALGKKDYAILLDCNTLDYNYTPLEIKGYSIIIMNTNKRRELADSKYNERRSECDRALEIIKQYKKVSSLCSVTEEELKTLEAKFDNPVLYKRARHAVTEQKRVLDATSALKEGDLKVFGALLNGSHQSLQEDYEVTGKELDALVHAAWQQEGVLGARMTGAGFGGCSIAVVNNEQVDTFIQNVGEIYLDTIGYSASFYKASIGDGPSVVGGFGEEK